MTAGKHVCAIQSDLRRNKPDVAAAHVRQGPPITVPPSSERFSQTLYWEKIV